MGPDILMKGVVASYLASPPGMEMIHNYISSEDGHTAIRDYLATPRGKQTAQDLLPLLLAAVDLPDDIRKSVQKTLGKKNPNSCPE
jgi:hypothetical protein